jgi:hypothetical protein
VKNVAGDSSSGPAAVPGAARVLPLPEIWQGIRQRVLPFRFPLAVIVSVGLVAAGQFVEDALDSTPLQMLSSEVSVARWTVVIAVLYMVVILKVLEAPVHHALATLQPIVKMDARDFHRYEERMKPPGARSGLVLLAISGAIVALLILVLGSDLPTVRDPVTHLPLRLSGDPALALVELAGYLIVGWAGLRLVYATIHLGRALGELADEPLDVNVFDTTSLLPFGRIALAVSLVPAGLIAIFLIGLGQPSGPVSWGVLTADTLACVLALVLPLRGVHRQMWKAKRTVLANVNRDITQVYGEINIPSASEPLETARLTNRTSTLIALRKVVTDMTTWPFQDTVAFGRAVLVASSPLIYTALNGLVTLFFIKPLQP